MNLPGDKVPANYVKAIMAVGYGGLRIVSRDKGQTWGDHASFQANGGDDDNLLRAVVWGNNLWIATGWKLVTSPDGKSWTDHGKIADKNFFPCNIVEGLAFANGFFYGACPDYNGPGNVYRSADGLSWEKAGTIGDTGGHLRLSYHDGKFVAFGDTKQSFVSTDAKNWSALSGVEQGTFCENEFKSFGQCHQAAWFDGFWFRGEWQGKILRSTDGTSFSQVYDDDQKNSIHNEWAIAEGYVAP